MALALQQRLPISGAEIVAERPDGRRTPLIAYPTPLLDESGRLVALGRMDGARPISVDIATNKAYTAASFKQPTQELSGVAGQAWFQSLIVSSNGKVTAGGGAIPLEDGGALAVAGGTDEQDHRCAEAAIRRFG